MSTLGKAKDKMLHGEGIFMFIRSSLSSQVASWIDLGLGYVLFSFFGLQAWIATCTGAVAGGIANCCINYRFTFHASSLSTRAVAIKYFLVWCGSLLLNTYGTAALYHLLSGVELLKEYGLSDDSCYFGARVAVSLIVSIVWNFLLQRYFVYRHVAFDDFINGGPGHHSHTTNA